MDAALKRQLEALCEVVDNTPDANFVGCITVSHGGTSVHHSTAIRVQAVAPRRETAAVLDCVREILLEAQQPLLTANPEDYACLRLLLGSLAAWHNRCHHSKMSESVGGRYRVEE